MAGVYGLGFIVPRHPHQLEILVHDTSVVVKQRDQIAHITFMALDENHLEALAGFFARVCETVQVAIDQRAAANLSVTGPFTHSHTT